ncbi:MAG: BMP family protein [Angelakisella sp.]
MKKILAIALSLVMVLAMVACGEEPAPTPDPDTDTPPVITNPDEIADEMTSEDGKYEIGFVTDVGQLKDKSFNQGTYDGVKLYAAANGLSYKYYQPANGDKATDDDRYDAMKAACDNGAKVVVCAGFLQEAALKKAAAEYPDVAFIFIDGYPISVDDKVLENVAPIAFAEEQCGYFAGYAVVKEGFEKLGFTGGGGGTNPACVRYGYGFVQGANDAAKEMGKTVDINYTWQFGNTFSPSPELMAMVSGWYNAGTEIVFCCGGNMFQSVAQAAAENDGAVVGVDTDQSFESETVVTSATKGLSGAVQWALAKVYDGTFSEIGGNSTSLGADNNAVGLPTATWSMQNFTVEEYEALFQKVLNGEVTIDNNSEMSNPAEAGLTNITVNFVA